MSKGIGRLFQVGIAKEGTRGTAESAATFWLPFSEASIDEKREFVNDEQAFGVIEDSIGATLIKKFAEGSIKSHIGDKSFGLILFAALGAKAVSGPTDSAYTHTITVGQSAQHPALTMFLDDPLGAQDYKHPLGMIDTLEINYELGKILEWNGTFRSKKGETATLTPSATSENKFTHKHVTFKVASNLAGLAAASALKIKSASIKVTKNLEDDDVLGSDEPEDFLNKQFTIEGTIEAMWQNESDFKTAFLAGTTKALRLQLINTDVTIGSSTNPSITIDLAKVSFTELTRPITANELVKQTLSFKAHYSSSDSKMVTCALVNTQASY